MGRWLAPDRGVQCTCQLPNSFKDVSPLALQAEHQQQFRVQQPSSSPFSLLSSQEALAAALAVAELR